MFYIDLSFDACFFKCYLSMTIDCLVHSHATIYAYDTSQDVADQCENIIDRKKMTML